MATVTYSNITKDKMISVLPLRIFENLVSYPRRFSNPTDEKAATLRLEILSKLQAGGASNGGGGQTISTLEELLQISPSTLLCILDPCLTYVECSRFISRIHDEYASRPQSAWELMCQDNASSPREERLSIGVRKIPTGLATLDACLLGGIPTGSITELVGRAGVGKTHLAQQLAVSAAFVDGGTVYIDAEMKLSLTRLREIAFERKYLSDRGCDSVQQPRRLAHAQQVLENVTIHPLVTSSELLDVLDRLEDEIILRNSEAAAAVGGETCNNDSVTRLPVRLVIIDSIAAPLRRDFDMVGNASSSNIAARRATAIFRIAKRLKQLAHDYQLAVAVINQVGSGHLSNRIDDKAYNQRNSNLDINDGEFSASLGTAWQYCVSTRIVLEHDNDPHRLQSDGQEGSTMSICTAALVKSLVSRRTKLSYKLTKQGLCEVTQTEA
jgi:RecA/RadA recombinase